MRIRTHNFGTCLKMRCTKTGFGCNRQIHYLHSLLEGPAARAIQGLTLATTNYGSAIQSLKVRFGRPQHLIATHMVEPLNVQAC